MRKFGWAFLGLLAIFFAASLRSGRDGQPANTSTTVPDRIDGFAIPVAGVTRAKIVDSWHDDREGGARVHEALDIPAPAGTPVVAAIDGRVEKLFLSKAGGITAYVRSVDGRWLTYYAHLERYVDGLVEGQALKRGEPLGFVGDTGNSGMGNTHLHFAVSRMRPGEKWYEGLPVNSYPLLAGKPSAR